MKIPNRRGLGVAAVFLSGAIFIAPAARADQAPRGKFLPNDPYEVPRTRYQELMDFSSFLPPPDKIQFETRMIWLEAAMAGYKPSFSWLGGKDATQMRFAAALKAEIEYIQNLGPEQKGPYYLAMMRDLGTLELADLDSTWLWQVSGAALADLLTGVATAGTMEVGEGRGSGWKTMPRTRTSSGMLPPTSWRRSSGRPSPGRRALMPARIPAEAAWAIPMPICA